MHLPVWWTWWYLWSFVKTFTPITISMVALYFVLHDRRAHLRLKAKRGEWYVLDRLVRERGMVFSGRIEIYNASSRPNAIREFKFLRQASAGSWIPLESQQYNTNVETGRDGKVFNQTPLALAPFAGIEADVQAIASMDQCPYEMKVKVVVEDLFGKRYTLDVKAVASPTSRG